MPSPAGRQNVVHRGDVIVLKLDKFERNMVLCSLVHTYICGSSRQSLHTEKQFANNKRLLRIRKEDIFDSAPKLFYDVI